MKQESVILIVVYKNQMILNGISKLEIKTRSYCAHTETTNQTCPGLCVILVAFIGYTYNISNFYSKLFTIIYRIRYQIDKQTAIVVL